MGKTPKARPTEYRGIVYRSKCEAMFARFLEIELQEHYEHSLKYRGKNVVGGGSGLIYEPTGYEVNQWCPDFLTWHVWPYQLHGAQHPHLATNVYEYKPARPTKTYIAEFKDKCDVLYERFLHSDEMTYRCTYYLYWGSVFNSDRGTVEYLQPFQDPDNGSGIAIETYDWLDGYEDAIRATRFDLEAN